MVGWLARPNMSSEAFIVTLPVCSRCAGEDPKIDYTDWENVRVRVVCHRRLREAWEEVGDEAGKS